MGDRTVCASSVAYHDLLVSFSHGDELCFVNRVKLFLVLRMNRYV